MKTLAPSTPVTLRAALPAPEVRGPRVPVAPVAAVCVLLATLGVGLIALLLGGGAPAAVPVGLPDPGRLVAWGLVASRAVAELAAVVTVGSLLVPALLQPGHADRTNRATALAAAMWSTASAVGWVLTACDTAGVPWGALDGGVLLQWGSGRVAAPGIVSLAAALVAVLALRCRSVCSRRLLLATSLGVAVLLPVLGHTGVVGDAGVAVSGLVVHVIAALLWTGGLAGMLLHLRHDQLGLALAAPRFSTLALGCYVVLAGSGALALTAVLPLSGPGMGAAWSSGYAGVVLAKLGVLVVLGVLGHWHRRSTLPLLATGRRGAFVRLAGVELAVMGAAMGLATALAATPTPPVPLDGAGHGEAEIGPISLAALLTTWRPNAVVVIVLALALTAYLWGAQRLESAGTVWPAHRTTFFTAGLVVAFLATCSGTAVWAPLLISVNLGQLLVALLVVPMLLLLGRPGTLAAALGGSLLPPALTRVAGGPVAGAVATCVLLLGVLRTPAVELSLRSPWWHLLVLVLAVACGTALLSSALGTDARDRARGTAEPAASLLLVSACLGLLALQLRVGDRLLAGGWFRELRLGWVEPLDDQRLAGLFISAGAVGMVALAVLVVAVGRRTAGDADPGS